MSETAAKYVGSKDLKEVQQKHFPSCPRCGGNSTKFLTHHGAFKFFKCEKCGVRFQYGGGNDYKLGSAHKSGIRI